MSELSGPIVVYEHPDIASNALRAIAARKRAEEMVQEFADLIAGLLGADVIVNLTWENIAGKPAYLTDLGVRLDNIEEGLTSVVTSNAGKVDGGVTLGDPVEGGASVFRDKLNDNLRFRRLVAGPGISFDLSNVNYIQINATGIGGGGDPGGAPVDDVDGGGAFTTEFDSELDGGGAVDEP